MISSGEKNILRTRAHHETSSMLYITDEAHLPMTFATRGLTRAPNIPPIANIATAVDHSLSSNPEVLSLKNVLMS